MRDLGSAAARAPATGLGVAPPFPRSVREGGDFAETTGRPDDAEIELTATHHARAIGLVAQVRELTLLANLGKRNDRAATVRLSSVVPVWLV